MRRLVNRPTNYFDKHVPITNRMKKKDVKNKYEYNTGLEILKTFKKQKLKPNKCPGILIRYHGVFAWGKSSYESVKNLELIENILSLFPLLIIFSQSLETSAFLFLLNPVELFRWSYTHLKKNKKQIKNCQGKLA